METRKMFDNANVETSSWLLSQGEIVATDVLYKAPKHHCGRGHRGGPQTLPHTGDEDIVDNCRLTFPYFYPHHLLDANILIS